MVVTGGIRTPVAQAKCIFTFLRILVTMLLLTVLVATHQHYHVRPDCEASALCNVQRQLEICVFHSSLGGRACTLDQANYVHDEFLYQLDSALDRSVAPLEGVLEDAAHRIQAARHALANILVCGVEYEDDSLIHLNPLLKDFVRLAGNGTRRSVPNSILNLYRNTRW